MFLRWHWFPIVVLFFVRCLDYSAAEEAKIGLEAMGYRVEYTKQKKPKVEEHLNSLVQKRYYVSDLTQKVLKVDAANLPTLIAIDTQRVDNNMITCMCHDDVCLFMEHHEKTQKYGDEVKNVPAYQPKKEELCVVGMKDGEGGYVWFRAKYQKDLVDDRVQVHCIDYDHTNVVRAIDIRVSRKKRAVFKHQCRI